LQGRPAWRSPGSAGRQRGGGPGAAGAPACEIHGPRWRGWRVRVASRSRRSSCAGRWSRGEECEAPSAARAAPADPRRALAGSGFGLVERAKVGLAEVSLLLSEARGCKRWPLRLPNREALGLFEAKAAGCWIRRYTGPLDDHRGAARRVTGASADVASDRGALRARPGAAGGQSRSPRAPGPRRFCPPRAGVEGLGWERRSGGPTGASGRGARSRGAAWARGPGAVRGPSSRTPRRRQRAHAGPDDHAAPPGGRSAGCAARRADTASLPRAPRLVALPTVSLVRWRRRANDHDGS
jgi:hypothetical protein